MNVPPVVNVARCDTDLTPSSPSQKADFLTTEHNGMNSVARPRASSVTPSERSNRSRITVAEDDPKIAEDLEINPNFEHGYSIRKPSFFDRALGYFGLYRQDKASMMQRQNSGWVSPWRVPVVVLSPRKDTDKVQVKKIGICTIDTGNTQGNIVSRNFVENVLEYPKSSIQELTYAEKLGGSGITGHKLIPKGAIYLTWYHNKSSRVFHNMRFLISEHSKIDLIIGARSCLEHGIQDEPNLMSSGNTGIYSRTPVPPVVKDDEKDELRKTKEEWNSKKADLEVKLTEAQLAEDEDEIKEVKKKLAKVSKKSAIADKRFEHCVATREKKLELAARIQSELNELLGLKELPQPSVTNSTAVANQHGGQQQAQMRTSRTSAVRPRV